MTNSSTPLYKAVTISGKVAAGTSTLSRHLQKALGWKYINAGALQREYDRAQGINENRQGALSRSDEHEKGIDAMTKQMLNEEKNPTIASA